MLNLCFDYVSREARRNFLSFCVFLRVNRDFFCARSAPIFFCWWFSRVKALWRHATPLVRNISSHDFYQALIPITTWHCRRLPYYKSMIGLQPTITGILITPPLFARPPRTRGGGVIIPQIGQIRTVCFGKFPKKHYEIFGRLRRPGPLKQGGKL